MESFSAALTSLVRERLPAAMAQFDAFSAANRAGRIEVDARLAKVWVGDREFTRSGYLGSLAEDRTFMWSWARDDLRGLPGIELSTRLREIGIRHDIPELRSALVDLDGFEDPWLAADRLALFAQAALGARGMAKLNHGGRAYVYVLVDDDAVPSAAPGPDHVDDYRRAAAELLAGGGERTVNTGGAPPPGTAPGFVPDALLAVLAPSAAVAMGRQGVPADAVVEPMPGPVSWHPAEGRVHSAGQPNSAFEAAAIGHYDHGRELWEWSDSQFRGSAAVRAAAAAHGADHLAAERVPLGASGAPRNAAYLLAMAATHLGGAAGWLDVPTATGRVILALTDPRCTAPGTDPDHACAALRQAAGLVNPLTRPHNRYPTMHSLVVGFLDHHGIGRLHVGEPYFTGGIIGLHELRAEFGSEGILMRVHHSPMGTFGPLGRPVP
ncbi:DUF6882 domain-containing protein [Nocardia sp. alder85J]|uniref:DUF6882 domain-containing protein n=1 Tax=Nocardia sp. alder85J TaxID=2862949 RepID=UPI001CD5F543|nr:DUF6882 domain-containing protein [Nocardia sp. alder85J]MCX4097426.1 hypothetical protein [Nocardia sp. alder85J]